MPSTLENKTLGHREGLALPWPLPFQCIPAHRKVSLADEPEGVLGDLQSLLRVGEG